MEKGKRTNNDIQEEFEDTKGTIRNNTMVKRKKNKQRSTKQTHKTIDRVTRTPLKHRVTRTPLKHKNTIRKTIDQETRTPLKHKTRYGKL